MIRSATDGLESLSNDALAYELIHRRFRNPVVRFMRERLLVAFGAEWQAALRRPFKDEEWAAISRSSATAADAGVVSRRAMDDADLLSVNHFFGLFDKYYTDLMPPGTASGGTSAKQLKANVLRWFKEIKDIRDPNAHPPEQDLPVYDALRAADTGARLLGVLGLEEAKASLEDIRQVLLRRAVAEPSGDGLEPARQPSRAGPQPVPTAPRVVLGEVADVGADYQHREFDNVLDQLWADGGDRRVWLRGGPGRGKSYSARRVMQQARADQTSEREDLLLWVDAADDAAVTEAFADAVDQLRECGFAMPVGIDDPAQRKAKALLRVLATSTWRWLIVLDNAHAGSLIDAGLIPTGVNPNGRVLLTTRSWDHRTSSYGRQVSADLFTPDEATAYLRSEVHSNVGGAGTLAQASAAEISRLADAVGYHPLALSIATGTIVANAMSVTDWLDEFAKAPLIDAAADERDRGGYPHLISVMWQIALGQASQGLPDGLVQRAAMVAALQDPDGHPTWVWERESVAGWVAGRTVLAARRGVPVPIQRLIDSGVLELRGGTWKHGQIAIHRLAARAVRELADDDSLADLAGTLLREWLLQITADQPGTAAIRRNLRPIAALPNLDAPARRAVTALLGWAQPESTNVKQEVFEDLAPYLAQGGALGKATMARRLVDIANGQEDSGLLDEARTTRVRAAETYRQVLEDPSLDDELRSVYLGKLGALEDRLDQPAKAREHRTQAVRILERRTQTYADTKDLLENLAALASLHDELGNGEETTRILDRAAALPITLVTHDPTGADRAPTREEAQARVTLGTQLRALGRAEDAKECFVQAAETYERLQDGSELHDVLGRLARLHIETADWAEAEACLRRVAQRESADGEDYLLLASVQQHLGRAHEAEQSVARSAEEYGELIADPQSPPTENLSPKYADRRRKLRARGRDMVLTQLLVQAHERERWDDAAGLASGLLDLAQQRSLANATDRTSEAELADAHQQVAGASFLAGRPEQAVHHLVRAVTIRQLLADLSPSGPNVQRDLARSLGGLGLARREAGHSEQALEPYTRSVSIYQRLTEQAPSDLSAQQEYLSTLESLGFLHAEIGNREQSLASLLRAISARQEQAELAPNDAQAQKRLAFALYSLGWTCFARFDEPEEASGWLTRSVATYRDVLTRLEPADFATREGLAQSLALLGASSRALARSDDAVRYLREAVDIRRDLAEAAPDSIARQKNLALALSILGAAHAEADQLGQAVDCLTSSTRTYQLLADLDPGKHERLLIEALRGLAETLTRLGRADEADAVIEQAGTLEERFPDPDDDEP